MFGEAGKPVLQEPFPQALPVSVVMRSFHFCSVGCDATSRYGAPKREEGKGESGEVEKLKR